MARCAANQSSAPQIGVRPPSRRARVCRKIAAIEAAPSETRVFLCSSPRAALCRRALAGRLIWTSAYLGLGFAVGTNIEAASQFLGNLSGLIITLGVLVVAGGRPGGGACPGGGRG